MSEQAPPSGRHRAATPARRRPRWLLATTAGIAAVAVAVGGAIATTPDPTPAAAAATMPADRAEQVFLAELGDAGIRLTPPQQAAAAVLAREHVGHGHLIGMRQQIRDDLAAAFPDLTAEEVDVARIVVEHHFLAVTGRKQ